MEFKQGPPRGACRSILGEGTSVPSLAQTRVTHRKEENVERSQNEAGKMDETRQNRRINILKIETAPKFPHQPRAKEQRGGGGIAGYNRCQE